MTGRPGDAEITEELAHAHRDRAAGRWADASHRYRLVLEKTGPRAELFHNLALCALGMADHRRAEVFSQRALALNPTLWQSRLLQGKIQRETDPSGERADKTFEALSHWIASGKGKTSASDAVAIQTLCDLERAELHFNVFCDAQSCLSLLGPHHTRALQSTSERPEQSHIAERVALTHLIARLYEREGITDTQMRDEATAFINRFVLAHAEPVEQRSRSSKATTAKRPKKKMKARPRIAVLSPGLHAGPVFYLCYQTLNALASDCLLVFFHRGNKSDWATEILQSIADEWIDASAMSVSDLAGSLQASQSNLVLELGGWMDIDGLKALARCPEIPSVKWVGGQAMSVGLPNMIGYISDPWQTPEDARALYSEPLWEMPLGYVSYTPPSYWPGPSRKKIAGAWGIIGNPLKLGPAILPLVEEARIKHGARRLRLIDKRYRSPRVASRIEALLAPTGLPIDWVIPTSHQEFLSELSVLADVIDTQPYSAGLTAREALSLGARLHGASASRLFSSCHGTAASQQAATLADQFVDPFCEMAQRSVGEAIAQRIRQATLQVVL